MYFHYKVIFGIGVITIKFTLQTILFFYLSIFFYQYIQFLFSLISARKYLEKFNI